MTNDISIQYNYSDEIAYIGKKLKEIEYTERSGDERTKIQLCMYYFESLAQFCKMRKIFFTRS